MNHRENVYSRWLDRALCVKLRCARDMARNISQVLKSSF